MPVINVFFADSSSSNSTFLIDNIDDFCDVDAQNVEVKSHENIIQNALLLLSEMSSSGSNPDQTKLVAQTVTRYLKNLEKISKMNSAAGLSTLNRFTSETLFNILDTLLTDGSGVLEGETVLEVLKVLQNVARMYLRHSSKPNLTSNFDPAIW